MSIEGLKRARARREGELGEGLFALQLAVGQGSGGGDKSSGEQPCTGCGREAILLGTVSREEPGMWVQPCQNPFQPGYCLW